MCIQRKKKQSRNNIKIATEHVQLQELRDSESLKEDLMTRLVGAVDDIHFKFNFNISY